MAKLYILLLFSCLSSYVYCGKEFSGEDFCSTCMGLNYTVCESPTDKWQCFKNSQECREKNFTIRTNMWTKCIKGAPRYGSTVLKYNPQCQYQYMITKDYYGRWNARTIKVRLAQNEVCAVHIVNMLESDDIKGRIQSNMNNKVSIAYMETPNASYMYYN